METRSRFHAELEALKGNVVALFGLVETARRNAVSAYIQCDQAMAMQVVEADRDINQLTINIEESCLKLLALEQPVALDLRRIVGYSRVAINLERLADEAVKIAEGARTDARLPGYSDSALTELSRHAASMFALAAKAFAEDDVDAAFAVYRVDARARELAVAALRAITEALADCSATPEAGVRAILACRSFERMAGHAFNIAEAVVFIVKGVLFSQQCQPR